MISLSNILINLNFGWIYKWFINIQYSIHPYWNLIVYQFNTILNNFVVNLKLLIVNIIYVYGIIFVYNLIKYGKYQI